MTLLALLYLLATAGTAFAVVFVAVPALAREKFQNRMSDLAARVDRHLADGTLAEHEFTWNLREAAYFYARYPSLVSLRTVWLSYQMVKDNKDVDQFEPERELQDLSQYSTAEQQHNARALADELADLCWTNSFRNTIFWLPLLPVPAVLRRIVARHDRGAETIEKVETVLTHRRQQELAIAALA